MVIVAATASPTQELEAVYRQDGDRLWRALVAFGGDPDLALTNPSRIVIDVQH